MNDFVQQPQLTLTTPNRIAVSIELIRSKKHAGAAFTLACDTSGLDDKEIFLTLGIDKGYFSNIKSGKNTLQSDLIKPFCEIVGNTIYPEWVAYQVGCTLVQIETETQRLLRVEIEKRIEVEKENALLKNILQGK